MFPLLPFEWTLALKNHNRVLLYGKVGTQPALPRRFTLQSKEQNQPKRVVFHEVFTLEFHLPVAPQRILKTKKSPNQAT